ncbi:RNA-binding domain superfamily, partial [Sesbania bispinosa]
MGTEAKKATKKSLKRATANKPSEGVDFLPLEGGPARKLPDQKPAENTATVLYVGRIPHGFYEKKMEGYFGQFGTIKRLRIARNKRVRLLNLVPLYLFAHSHVVNDWEIKTFWVHRIGISQDGEDSITVTSHWTPSKLNESNMT